MRTQTATFPGSRQRMLVTAAAVVLLAGGALTALSSHAQAVYRIVGADGKVTFSDKPPAAASGAKVTSADTASSGTAATGLPFELRQVASKYPVTLYTGSNCAPCGTARALLSARGVPFTEKTVNSNDDIQALQRISGEASLPFATVGSQQLKGFSDAEWTQFLNAAGYPAASVLPAGYRAPAATPLVAVSAAPAPAATPASRATAATPPVPVMRPNASPNGIQF